MAVTQATRPAASEKAQARATTGEAAAALISGGIGCFIIGLLTTLAEFPALVDFRNALNWWNPAGPLTGKTGVGVIGFFVAWAITHYLWKGKDLDLKRMFTIAMVLLALGFLLTFPPFFELFA